MKKLLTLLLVLVCSVSWGAGTTTETSLANKTANLFLSLASTSRCLTLFTKDLADGSTINTYTGFGFKPRSFVILAQVNASNMGSICLGDDTAVGSIFNDGNVASGTFGVGATIICRQSAGNQQEGVVSSISDGISVSWTKTGSINGTAYIFILAFR